MYKLVCAALLAGAVLGAAGCSKDPNDYSSWTGKLTEPRESERALTALEKLGDPRAITAIGDVWKDTGKPPHLIEIIIGLARPMTPEEADAKSFTDFDGKEGRQSGRPESWESAAPYLIEAITNVDEANPHQVDSAGKAAGALGEAKISRGLDALIELAQKPPTKKLLTAQVEAVRAIGHFDGDREKAVAALVKIVDAEPPINPMKVKEKAEQRAAAEKYQIYQAITSQAIDALGRLRSPGGTKALVLSLYRAPDLFTYSRRALVAIGPEAEKSLNDVLMGTNADVNQLFKDKKLDRYCGDKGEATGDQCQPVSARDFSAAVVLGDFYDPKSVPALLTALGRPALPVGYVDDAPTPNTQYNAIFDSLRKIGSAEAAPAVRAMWDGKPGAAPVAPAPAKCPPGKKCPAAPAAAAAAPAAGGSDPAARALAVNAYPFVAHDAVGTDALGGIAADNKAEDNLRQEAALAYARLATDPKAADVMNGLAQKYFDASAKKRAEADGKPKADSDAADKELEVAKKARDTAQQDALKATHDTTKTAEDIRAAVEKKKKTDDDYKTANTKHKAAVAPYKGLDRQAKDYKSFARMFQTHIARIEVAVRCKQDINCYAATLKEKPDDAAKNCASYIKDIKDWTADEKLGLLDGEVERAMLEIGKQGTKAQSLTEALLDNAKSDDRVIRQSILLALPKIAKIPCDSCEAKLQIAIKAGEGKSTLGDLNLETSMMLNYFSWAGGRVPKDAPAAAAAKPADAPPAK